jgi:hypothetical protein
MIQSPSGLRRTRCSECGQAVVPRSGVKCTETPRFSTCRGAGCAGDWWKGSRNNDRHGQEWMGGCSTGTSHRGSEVERRDRYLSAYDTQRPCNYYLGNIIIITEHCAEPHSHVM